MCVDGETKAEYAQTVSGLFCVEHEWGADHLEQWVCLYCLIYGIRSWQPPEVVE